VTCVYFFPRGDPPFLSVDIQLYYIVLCYIMLYHITFYNISCIMYYVLLNYIISYYIHLAGRATASFRNSNHFVSQFAVVSAILGSSRRQKEDVRVVCWSHYVHACIHSSIHVNKYIHAYIRKYIHKCVFGCRATCADAVMRSAAGVMQCRKGAYA